MSTRRSVSLATAVLGAAFVAWLVTVQRMEGMNGGPGTDLGALGWYVGVWVTMMAAMMLPSVAPMVLLYARVSKERASRGREFVPTWIFVLAYLAVWAAYGLAAYGIFRLVKSADPSFLSWRRDGASLLCRPAIWWCCAPPAPTGWPWPRSTTPALARRKCWWTAALGE